MQSTINQVQARIDTLENQNEDLRKLLSHSQDVTTEQFPHPASPLAIRDQRKAALDELAHEGIEAAKKEAAKSALNSAPHYPFETILSETQKEEFIYDMEILTKFINGKESLNGRTIQDEANVTILSNKPECESDKIMFAKYFSHLNTHSIQWITNALTNLDGNIPLPPITNIHSLHTSLAYIIMQKYNVEDLTPPPPL